jgi:adenine nucleotide transporter 17
VESKRAQTSTLDAVRHIIQREGVAGLYAGLESALFGISVTNFVYYYCTLLLSSLAVVPWTDRPDAGYEWTRAGFERAAVRAGRASKKLTTVESMLAGALAGSATVLITNPIWVVNTRITARKNEAADEARPAGTIGTIRALLRDEGVAALFAGVLPALVLVINPILQYSIFEQLKNGLEKRRRVTPRDAFCLGAVGKLLATSLTYPYITVKSRQHVARRGGPADNMIEAVRRIVREEGWAGLYKGT